MFALLFGIVCCLVSYFCCLLCLFGVQRCVQHPSTTQQHPLQHNNTLMHPHTLPHIQATQNPICFSLIPELFPSTRTTAMAFYNAAIYAGRALSFGVAVLAERFGVISQDPDQLVVMVCVGWVCRVGVEGGVGRWLYRVPCVLYGSLCVINCCVLYKLLCVIWFFVCYKAAHPTPPLFPPPRSPWTSSTSPMSPSSTHKVTWPPSPPSTTTASTSTTSL